MYREFYLTKCGLDGRCYAVVEPSPVGGRRLPDGRPRAQPGVWLMGAGHGLVVLTSNRDRAVARCLTACRTSRDRLSLGKSVARNLSPPCHVLVLTDTSRGLAYVVRADLVGETVMRGVRRMAKKESWWIDEDD